MSLKDEMAADVDDLLLQEDDFAIEGGISYTRKETEVTVTGAAIRDPVIDSETGKVIESSCRLLISETLLGAAIKPAAGDTGETADNSRAFRVMEVEEAGPGGYVLLVDVGAP